MSTSLTLVPSDNPITPEDDDAPTVRKRLLPTETHVLAMAQAQERVVQLVRVPPVHVDTMRVLTAAMDSTITARAIADALSGPLYDARPVHPGAAWAAAENAAQANHQAYRSLLTQAWPVADWQEALHAIAMCAAQQGAWTLLHVVSEALADEPGSPSWWDAVLHVYAMWSSRGVAA